MSEEVKQERPTKIVKMVNGQDIIGKVFTSTDENDDNVYIESAYLVFLRMVPSPNSPEGGEIKLQFQPYFPLSSDKIIPLSPIHIVTIANAEKQVLDSYEQLRLQNETGLVMPSQPSLIKG